MCPPAALPPSPPKEKAKKEFPLIDFKKVIFKWLFCFWGDTQRDMYYKINQKKGKRKEERNTKSLSLFFFFFSFDFSLSLLFSHVCSSPIKKFPSTLHRFPLFGKEFKKTHTYGVYPPFWGENAWLFSIFFGVRHIAKVESFLWVCVQSDCKNDLLCFLKETGWMVTLKPPFVYTRCDI